MPAKFDPHASWQPLRDRANATENPHHKQLLQAVADHMEAEIHGRFEPLMATLTAQPVYHFWRLGPQNMTLQGYDAVADFYRNMFTNGGQQFVNCHALHSQSVGISQHEQSQTKCRYDSAHSSLSAFF